MNDAAPGAEHRRDSLPRHLHGGAPRRPQHARPGGAGRCPRSPTLTGIGWGPGRPRRLRRHPLAGCCPCSGTVAGLPDRRRAARQEDVILATRTRGVDVLPPRTLPPQALVVALTPLLDERAAGRCSTCARAASTPAVDVSPIPFAHPGGRGRSWMAARSPALAAPAGRRCARVTSGPASRSPSGATESRSRCRWRRCWSYRRHALDPYAPDARRRRPRSCARAPSHGRSCAPGSSPGSSRRSARSAA